MSGQACPGAPRIYKFQSRTPVLFEAPVVAKKPTMSRTPLAQANHNNMRAINDRYDVRMHIAVVEELTQLTDDLVL